MNNQILQINSELNNLLTRFFKKKSVKIIGFYYFCAPFKLKTTKK